MFSFVQNGVIATEAAVPASPPTRAARIFVEYGTGVRTTPGRPELGEVDVNTGIALVNRGSSAANIAYTLRDALGRTLTTGHGSTAAGAHYAKLLHQLAEIAPDFNLPGDFASTTRHGSLEISSDQPVSVVALRLTLNQRGEALLTTVPVADSTSEPTSGPVYFPQVADGGGYMTTLVLLNTSGTAETGSLALFDDSGAPLVVNQAGGTRDSLFRYAVPAGGVFVFQSDGFPPAAVTGWARLDPDPNTARPFAAGIFGLDQNGVRVTETGIPAQAPTTHARIFVDQSGNYDTGLALVSPAGSAISVKLKAFRCDGSTPTGTAAASVNIGGHSHTSQFVSQFMPGLPRHFKGMLDLSSDSPFVALTLRALITARGDFLLMTLPTADLSQTPPKPMIFPQIADGGGYSTEFILLSAGAPSTTVVGFFADDGTPLPAGK